jgi:hypothetical protein
LSATLHCAESFHLGSGGLFWIERNLALRWILFHLGSEVYYGLSATLHCTESYYLGSGGLLWIYRDLALRRILSFGL